MWRFRPVSGLGGIVRIPAYRFLTLVALPVEYTLQLLKINKNAPLRQFMPNLIQALNHRLLDVHIHEEK